MVFRYTDEYLKQCRGMSAESIVRFLEDYRTLRSGSAPLSKKEALSRRYPPLVTQVLLDRIEGCA